MNGKLVILMSFYCEIFFSSMVRLRLLLLLEVYEYVIVIMDMKAYNVK